MFGNKMSEIRTIKVLLTRAETLAHEMGDDLPGAEHLLLSALELPEGSARQAFEQVGADPDAFRSSIDAQYDASLAAVGIEVDPTRRPTPTWARSPTKAMRFNPSGRTAFQAATRLAKAHRPVPFCGAHIVAAVADLEQGTAARTLVTMEVDRAELHAAAIAVLEEWPGPVLPPDDDPWPGLKR